MATPLPGFLASLAPILDHYGYWAIAGLLLLENIGVPVVPGEFSLIAGAIYAGAGQLNVVVVGVVGVVVSFTGAEIGYAIGRYGGHTLVLRYGKYVFIKPHHLHKAETAVDKYGGVVVVIARFIVGLRELNGIIAGITEMHWVRFMIYNAIGAVLWIGVWVSAGYAAGDHIGAIYADAQRYSLLAVAVLAVLAAAVIARAVLRRRRRAAAPPSPAPEGDRTARP
jgi:membrane protein DedA with SNARE-associated domain